MSPLSMALEQVRVGDPPQNSIIVNFPLGKWGKLTPRRGSLPESRADPALLGGDATVALIVRSPRR